MQESEKYSVLKIDLDIKPPNEWLNEWIKDKIILLKLKGIEVVKVNKYPTEKGWHFWFHIKPEVDYYNMAKLQFLLGDDHSRVYFTLQRKGFKRFRGLFNILFGKKLKVEQNG